MAALILAALGAADAGADGRPLPALVGADALHERGITGRGVTIAVLGGGGASAPGILRAAGGHERLLAVFDAASGSVLEPPFAPTDGPAGEPPCRLLEAMLSSGRDPEGGYRGIAPGADLVLVRALGDQSLGSAAAVARGIEWVVANRQRYGIRVLALPLAAPPGAGPGEGEMSRAVVDAWAAGIVVVAAAGDGGPAPASVAAPGVAPQVVTVGAATVAGGQMKVAGYSAGGPAVDGRVKPEVVAPSGPAGAGSPAPEEEVRRLATGTGVAAAVVSGVVALALEASPWLTPAEVKLGLLLGARPLLGPEAAASSWLRQGAGLVDAFATVAGSAAMDVERGRADGGLAWLDGVAGDLVWSGGAGRGMIWSEGAVRGITWSELEAGGTACSGGAVRRSGGSQAALRGLVWSE